MKEGKGEEEILLEKKEDAKSGHIKIISVFALLLFSVTNILLEFLELIFITLIITVISWL